MSERFGEKARSRCKEAGVDVKRLFRGAFAISDDNFDCGTSEATVCVSTVIIG
jgi:hypothetical protein